MSIYDHIKSRTAINTDQQSQNYSWENVTKNKKHITPPRGKGEIPYQLETYDTNFSCNFQNLNQRYAKKRKPTLCQKNSFHQDEIMENQIVLSENNFAGIIPSVREVNGGWNTQSNEVIERRHRERQQKYAEDNCDLNSSDSLSATYTTVSSETTDSYKTAIQDLYESKQTNQQGTTSEKSINSNIERYKKNALMTGLLQEEENNYPDKDETFTEYSADFLDASGSISDIQNEMTNLDIDKDEDSMRQDRLCRLFQSQEDDDVFCHPLNEQIKNDPEWKNQRLKRKGIETTQTARQYYLNIENDSFAFQPSTK